MGKGKKERDLRENSHRGRGKRRGKMYMADREDKKGNRRGRS